MVTGASVVTLEPRNLSDDPFLLRLSERVFAPYSAFPGATMSSMLEEPFTVTMVARTRRAPKPAPPGEAGELPTTRGDSVGFFVLCIEPYGRAYGPIAAPVLSRLNAIAVVPELQGKGIGSFLLEGAMHLARRHSALSISLMTATANRAARRLFDRQGFRYLFAVEAAYARSQRAFVMTKVL
jgi:ribosomal protein S18 acetylase RimI-like enzyme